VADASSDDDAQFYVVAPAKFLLMLIGTAGLYGYYWFYRNWALLNRKHKQYWPVMRALFSVFFTHSLYAEIDHSLTRRGAAYRWSPGVLATVYVVASIASHILDRLAGKNVGSPWTDLSSVLLLAPMVWSMLAAQRAINIAEGDPAGSGNRGITAANVAWLVLGGLLWLLVLLGLYLMIVEGVVM
jgi:hypothetical protein